MAIFDNNSLAQDTVPLPQENGYKTEVRWCELRNKDGVFITTDLVMMGVAGDNLWGIRPYEEYSIPAKDYSFKFSEPIL